MKRLLSCLLCLCTLLSIPCAALAEHTAVLLIATEADGAAFLIHMELDRDAQRVVLSHMSGDEALGEETVASRYAEGGADGLADALESWVHSQYTATVSLEGAAAVLDLLGGVPLALTEAERVSYGLPASSGLETADGETVLAFVQDALDGTAEQRRRLLDAADALFRVLATKSLNQLIGLIPRFLECIRTNMPLNAMVVMAKDFVNLKDAPLIVQSLIPKEEAAP
ncbi:MAG TPA: hypothetical protein PKE04_17020 [Clostridia bacterium]|nr:hypothetical protein [Clostridia bacterium]